jgi:MFS superfamily sulfate permease-like transporter
MSHSNSKKNVPKDGLEGLKENWRSDILSGFLVSLIALPLSLGIASASGFPMIMGVLTAIVGGIIVSFFSGSVLTIKGPAAGLIVIVAGAVDELGRGNPELGWKLTLGVIVFAGLLQVVFGLFKVASLADFFPLSAVHGMLAAIGIIIISKQVHFALGIPPSELKGKEPVELISMIPESILNMNLQITVIAVISLIILFGMPMIKNKIFKSIPPALIVIAAGVGLAAAFNFSSPEMSTLKPLVDPGEFSLSVNVDFSGITGETTYIFLKYLLMFTLIGSLESILTGKAIDLLDPYKRKARLSQDLGAVGLGNIVSGFLGGLPMISEVARSSANLANGGKTRWANFYHGLFLLMFVVLLVPVIKMVPVVSLAAMLIFIGYRLASPKTFFHAYETGKEQFLVFITTIVLTICTDLLVGIAGGILVEILINLYNGLEWKNLFKVKMTITRSEEIYTIKLTNSCTFSNWISFNNQFSKIPKGKKIIIDASHVRLLDHTFMENIIHYQDEYEGDGGKLVLEGIEGMNAHSASGTAGRNRKRLC